MERVVVVSDNSFLRHLIAFALEDLNAEVDEAVDWRDVAADCREGEVDVVIMASLAPILNGSRMVNAVRAARQRRPRLYMLSRCRSEHGVLSALECGVNQYMTLPVNLQRLRAKVANELSESR